MSHTSHKNRQAGFGLVELSIALLILGMLLVSGIALLRVVDDRDRLDDTAITMSTVDSALLGFVAANSRLPCPDTNANGLEGAAAGCIAGVNVGRVPYRTLGLPDPTLDEAHINLRYGVYRNPNAPAPDADVDCIATPDICDADLAVLRHRQYPVLPLDTVSENQNDLDFCFALRNARRASLPFASNTYVNTRHGGVSSNAAYVLASGGVSDANGNNIDNHFDGANENSTTTLSFDSPARLRGTDYDDLVSAMPFDVLETRLSCAAITTSVNSAALVAIVGHWHRVIAESQVDMAELAVANNAALLAAQVIYAAAAIIQGTEAAFLLAGNIGASLCPCTIYDAACIPTSGAAIVSAIAMGVFATVGIIAQSVALSETTANLTDAEALLVLGQAFETKTLNDALSADAEGGQRVQ